MNITLRLFVQAAFILTFMARFASAEEAISPDASKPPSSPGVDPIVLKLTPSEAADLLAILDVAIKTSGYNPITLKALRIGQKLEQAGAGR